jgi:hypothetical protein
VAVPRGKRPHPLNRLGLVRSVRFKFFYRRKSSCPVGRRTSEVQKLRDCATTWVIVEIRVKAPSRILLTTVYTADGLILLCFTISNATMICRPDRMSRTFIPKCLARTVFTLYWNRKSQSGSKLAAENHPSKRNSPDDPSLTRSSKFPIALHRTRSQVSSYGSSWEPKDLCSWTVELALG